jgi:ATP-dependent protease Clp ATPase subunit
VLEDLLLPLMFDLPSRDDVREVLITAEAVRGDAEAHLLLSARTG